MKCAVRHCSKETKSTPGSAERWFCGRHVRDFYDSPESSRLWTYIKAPDRALMDWKTRIELEHANGGGK